MNEDTLGKLAGEGGDLLSLEGNDAIYHGHKRIVTCPDHIGTRVEFGTALTDEDIAYFCGLTAKKLDAEALGDGIATELG